MRTWLATVLVAACATVPVVSGPGVRIDGNLLDFLAWAQTQARTETVLCLTGAYVQGVIVVDGATPPKITAQTDSSAQYGGCRGRGMIGTFHNHSGRFAQYCTFSDNDRESFKDSRLLFDLLSCGVGEFRYATYADTTTRVLERRAR